MATHTITWDWKEQPPLGKIAEAVKLLSGGTVTMHEPDTGADFYALIIADEPLTDEQAQTVFEENPYQGGWGGTDETRGV
jgi:hypothetical protein